MKLSKRIVKIFTFDKVEFIANVGELIIQTILTWIVFVCFGIQINFWLIFFVIFVSKFKFIR